MTKCLNHATCQGKAKEPHALCQKCLDAIQKLTGLDDEKKLRRLEEKPRGGREWLKEISR
jgi:hypothetical protein